MRVILSARVAWAVAKDTEVTKKVRTASMMARKSRVDIEICYDNGAVVHGPATSVGAVVLGVEGPRGIEDAGVVGNGALIAIAGTDEAAN